MWRRGLSAVARTSVHRTGGRACAGSVRALSSASDGGADHAFDVVIMGGGVMGSSAAYHIAAADPSVKVAVVERDRTYEQASCVLSAGGMRMQFSNVENIDMCRYSGQFLRDAPINLALEDKDGGVDNDHCDVQFRETGYLFLANTESGAQVLRENCELQRAHGAQTVVLGRDELKQRYPWMNVEDLVAGSIGEAMEGSFDPWSLLVAMRRKAQQLGVTFVDGQVVALDTEPASGGDATRVVGVHVRDPKDTTITTTALSAGQVVNACGAWSRPISAMAGIDDWPVFPRLRTVYVIHAPQTAFESPPFTIDPSGVYCRREGRDGNAMWICGTSPTEDEDMDHPPAFNLHTMQADDEVFYDVVWPGLAHRSPAFEEARLVSSWVGFYDFNPLDHNAIIGRDPRCENMVLISGFSGHGLMQSPAAGRAVAELVLHGEFRTLDLSRMAPTRFRDGKLLPERNII